MSAARLLWIFSAMFPMRRSLLVGDRPLDRSLDRGCPLLRNARVVPPTPRAGALVPEASGGVELTCDR
jgi:hypothetical protein